MKTIIIRRLFESFGELEKAIVSAKHTLQQKDNPPETLLKRINCYEEMLIKQKTLATALCGYASLGDWEEVARHIKLISAMSAMIRDDAREILEGATQESAAEERESMVC